MFSCLKKKSESPSRLRVERDAKELGDFWCQFLSSTKKVTRELFS